MPTVSALVVPISGLNEDTQQNIVDYVGASLKTGIPTTYYSRCWTIMGILTINGAIESVGQLLAGTSNQAEDPTIAPATYAPVADPTNTPIANTHTPSRYPTGTPSSSPSNIPTQAYICEVSTAAQKYAIISEFNTQTRISNFKNKGLLVGGDLDYTKNNKGRIDAMSFVRGNYDVSEWIVKNDALHMGFDSDVDFDHLKYVADHAVAYQNGNDRVIIKTSGGAYSNLKLFFGKQASESLVVFQTTEDVFVNYRGSNVNFNILAPYAKVTVNADTIDGLIIGKEVVANANTHNGQVYEGGLSCV